VVAVLDKIRLQTVTVHLDLVERKVLAGLARAGEVRCSSLSRSQSPLATDPFNRADATGTAISYEPKGLVAKGGWLLERERDGDQL
jgi:hypothetical protein